MQIFLTIGNLNIPTYGLMITLGLLSANVIAYFMIRKYKLDMNDFIVIEGYVLLGGFIGAKLLYLFVERNSIDWYRFFHEQVYFSSIMRGGFVFYGGLIGGLLCLLLARKLHRISCSPYIHAVIFLVPWIHGFGRVGCFLAGCCYGIPYDGPIAVQFPENSLAPSHTTLFPIQLVEAIALLALAIALLILTLRGFKNVLATYLISYAIIRFFLEYYRHDPARGYFLWFSTSQWISFGMILLAVALMIVRKKFKK